jgi:transaldolase/glucose-6-phosphate isomerase
LDEIVSKVRNDGFTQVLLMGMGGSSLASEVMSYIYADSTSGLKLTVLDSTDPDQVLYAALKNPVPSTLYIVSSKSGGTAEVNAMFDSFWQRARSEVGEKAREHFIAITDPGTSLEKMASEHNFRKIFLGNPNIGGRFSALSAFGLVPAALMGIDVRELLRCAAWMASESSPDQPLGRNPGFVLGAVLGEAFNHSRDKLTLIADRQLEPFGAWLEQLVAESSGKRGKGIVPVVGEPLEKPEMYGADRIFFYLRRDGKFDNKVKRLRKAGHPVLVQELQDNSAIASEFYKWEIAVATACTILGVNAFDQPDVQDSKNRTVAKISYYKANHKFNESKPTLVDKGMYLYGNVSPKRAKIADQVIKFTASAKPGDYVAINAYLMRDRKNQATLQKLRSWIMARTKLSTTVGFGPRYLHSTGQLHKGGANNGLFLVITADPTQDLDIPHEDLSFGIMLHGQALGDLEALEARDRRVLHIHLTEPELLSTLVDQIVEK